MKEKASLLPFILFWFCKSLFCQSTSKELLNLSREYYLSAKKFSVIVESKFKNTINIDTVNRLTECFINKGIKIMLFRNQYAFYQRYGTDEYTIYADRGHYEKTKEKNKKYAAYQNEFMHYPFTETNLFFNRLLKNIISKTPVADKDSVYVLISNKSLIEFRKHDFSIKSITETTYDPVNKGFQFHQVTFHPLIHEDPEVDYYINQCVSVIGNPKGKIETVNRNARPNHIETVILKSHLNKIVNGDIGSIEGKKILLNFFYQGCYPCIKAYPYINTLFDRIGANSKAIILGVDHLERDTLTIEKYIEKYNLKFPVLIGFSAAFLTEYFMLDTFPSFIIIDLDGKVLEIIEGFTRKSFEKATKKLIE
jgi:hypothetical protein